MRRTPPASDTMVNNQQVEVPAEPAAAAIAAPEVAAVTAPEVAISSPSQSDAERRAAAEALKKELAVGHAKQRFRCIGSSEVCSEHSGKVVI